MIYKPLRVIGGKMISVGEECHILNGLRIEAINMWLDKKYHPNIEIGNYVTIGQNCHVTSANSVRIENNVSIMPDVLITDIEHEYVQGKSLRETGIIVGSVIIEENAVIGAGAKILGGKGLTIGRNAVVGANSVVKKSVEPNTVVAGVPASVIKENIV